MVEENSNGDSIVAENIINEEVEVSINEIVSKTKESWYERFTGFFKRFFKE